MGWKSNFKRPYVSNISIWRWQKLFSVLVQYEEGITLNVLRVGSGDLKIKRRKWNLYFSQTRLRSSSRSLRWAPGCRTCSPCRRLHDTGCSGIRILPCSASIIKSITFNGDEKTGLLVIHPCLQVEEVLPPLVVKVVRVLLDDGELAGVVLHAFLRRNSLFEKVSQFLPQCLNNVPFPAGLLSAVWSSWMGCFRCPWGSGVGFGRRRRRESSLPEPLLKQVILEIE